ncbi:hypothetical protein [Yersinia ruckeri]|uniref:hypothetical protein n=1 Tax=Yersinia ruckeri TaxID=29486 RepID=UPI000A564994|nr:hypothetical protein [Yersinia ruckeri]WMS05874.1 hypothetical protein RDY86_01490 [Yersinia ruckeri]
MVERIDYKIEKYSFAEINETPRIAQQWAEVIKEWLHASCPMTLGIYFTQYQ